MIWDAIEPILTSLTCLGGLYHQSLSAAPYYFRKNAIFVFIATLHSRYVQIIRYIKAWRSYSFVCTFHYIIIIIIQTYRWVLCTQSTCQVNYLEIVSRIMYILSIIFLIILLIFILIISYLLCIMYSVYGTVHFHILIVWEYLYFILSPPLYLKYELFKVISD